MRIVRILLPFLFVRDWYSGEWELSQPRLIIFAGVVVLFLLACAVVVVLQAPVEYVGTTIE